MKSDRPACFGGCHLDYSYTEFSAQLVSVWKYLFGITVLEWLRILRLSKMGEKEKY